MSVTPPFLIWLMILFWAVYTLAIFGWIFRAGQFTRVTRKLSLGLLCVCLAYGAGWAAWRTHDRKLAATEEVDLTAYTPFANAGTLARLDAPATLRLTTGSLPKIDGSTAFYPLYAAFVEAVYPQGDYPLARGSRVQCSKTDEAYNNLLRGSVDVIFVPGPSPRVLESAANSSMELRLTPIGKEAFVFFVNPANPVQGLSREEIFQIYEGKLTNWADAGGPDQTIAAYQRPRRSGSQVMLESIMRGRKLMTPPEERVAGGMGAIIQATAYRNRANAIGYSFLYYATRMKTGHNLRILAVDGVEPNEATIADGSYPFTTQFYAVTTGQEKPETRALIDWILSPQGQELVRKTGYVPLN